ncbi:hypothetical protein DVK85_13380 [Flavobacterium arcticum]|uniref:Uncharacterized protein n=1 Tax=Flavobacterium arcticum TaxID=1784713 RepID=A0A345HF05_9FLAO|nr:hypothetical protein DVK85_13380 [Flavobacterium arcticum]
MNMKKIDYKHIAFHTIVAFYFIWFIIFVILNSMALINAFGVINTILNNILTTLILLNFFMGVALFFVFKLFQNKSVLDKIIRYSFIIASVLSIITILTLKFKT